MASFTLVCTVGLVLVGVTWAQLMATGSTSDTMGPLAATNGGMGSVPYGGSLGSPNQGGLGGTGMQNSMPQNQYQNPNMYQYQQPRQGYGAGNAVRSLMWGNILDLNPWMSLMLGGMPQGQTQNPNQNQGGGGGYMNQNMMLPFLFGSMW